MKVVGSSSNSITLGDFTDYQQGLDVVHKLELVTTLKTSVYHGYLTGIVEKLGKVKQLTRHPLNCNVQLF